MLLNRPPSRLAIAKQALPRLPQHELELSPARPQADPSSAPVAAPPVKPLSSSALQTPQSKPDYASAMPSAVNPQQQALLQALQPDQPTAHLSDVADDPMSQPAQCLQLNPAAVSLVNPLLIPDAFCCVPRAVLTEPQPATAAHSLDMFAPAELPPELAESTAGVQASTVAETVLDPAVASASAAQAASDASRIIAEQYSAPEAARVVAGSPMVHSLDHASTAHVRQDMPQKPASHSPIDRAVRGSSNRADMYPARSRADRHSPRDAASPNVHRPHKRLAPWLETRQAVEHQVEACRPHRRFEEHPSSFTGGPARKRSQTPDAQSGRYAKHSRTDKWQPVALPSHALTRTGHHKSWQGSQSHHRAQLDTLSNHQGAGRFAMLCHQEVRGSSQSFSPRSGRHTIVPNGSHMSRIPSEGRFVSPGRHHSMSLSPSPVDRKTPQPGEMHPIEARSCHTAAQRNSVVSEGSGPGRRDAMLGDKGAPCFDHNAERQLPGAQLDSMPDSSLSGDDRQHRSHSRHSHVVSHDPAAADPAMCNQHMSSDLPRHRPAFHHRSQSDLHDDDLYRGHHTDHQQCVPSKKAGRWHAASHMDGAMPPHAPRIAPPTDRYAPRVKPALSQTDRHHRHHSSKAEFEAAAKAQAQKLDWDVDQMLAKLLGAYGKPAEAIGDSDVLEAMKAAVKLIGDTDEGAYGSPVFIATCQVSL